ncbi:MAG: ABC transporter substrate-binding protein [Halalkalicoccus sp.]
MSEQTRRDALRTLAAVGVASLAGCGDTSGSAGSSEEPPLPSRRDLWVTGAATAERTLLPHRASDAASRDRLELLLDGPYGIDEAGERVPYWLSLEEHEAGERYEAVLREGLRWSDPYGPMTAGDWAYYVRQIHQGVDNWAGSRLAAHWEGVEIEPLDDRRFELRLAERNVEFPESPALRRSFGPPRERIEPYVEERDREGLETDEAIAGLEYTGNLGPYAAASREAGERFLAERNDEYYMRRIETSEELWAEAPYFDRYEYRVFDDERARLQALRSGSITTTTVPPARFGDFATDDDRWFYRERREHVSTLAFNQRANGWEPLREPAVRRALSMAIGKERIAESVLEGYGEPIHTFQPAWSDWHAEFETPGIGENYSHRAAAMELDSALGADYGYDGATLVGPEGEPVELTFVHASDGRPTALAGFIQRELEHLGIAIDRRAVDFGTLLSSYVENEWIGNEGDASEEDGGDETDEEPSEDPEGPPWSAGEYNAGPRESTASDEPWDLLCGLGLNAYPHAPATTARYWLENGDMNFSGYVPEAALAELYERARTDEDREDALEELFATLAAERPADFLVSQDAIVGYHHSIAGPGEDVDWRIWYAGRR